MPKSLPVPKSSHFVNASYQFCRQTRSSSCPPHSISKATAPSPRLPLCPQPSPAAPQRPPDPSLGRPRRSHSLSSPSFPITIQGDCGCNCPSVCLGDRPLEPFSPGSARLGSPQPAAAVSQKRPWEELSSPVCHPSASYGHRVSGP